MSISCCFAPLAGPLIMTIYMRTIYEKEQGQELASELDAVVLGHGKVQAGHI